MKNFIRIYLILFLLWTVNMQFFEQGIGNSNKYDNETLDNQGYLLITIIRNSHHYSQINSIDNIRTHHQIFVRYYRELAVVTMLLLIILPMVVVHFVVGLQCPLENL